MVTIDRSDDDYKELCEALLNASLDEVGHRKWDLNQAFRHRDALREKLEHAGASRPENLTGESYTDETKALVAAHKILTGPGTESLDTRFWRAYAIMDQIKELQ